MPYADGFVLAIPKRQVQNYLRIARRAGRIWRDHGALEYRECVGDDLKTGMGVPFPRLAKAKPDALVMHPGPMNRGVEIDSIVADGAQSLIREQVEMGVAVRMAVLEALSRNLPNA